MSIISNQRPRSSSLGDLPAAPLAKPEELLAKPELKRSLSGPITQKEIDRIENVIKPAELDIPTVWENFVECVKYVCDMIVYVFCLIFCCKCCEEDDLEDDAIFPESVLNIIADYCGDDVPPSAPSIPGGKGVDDAENDEQIPDLIPIDPVPLPIDPVPLPIDPVPLPIDPVPLPIDPVPLPIDPVPLPIDPVPHIPIDNGSLAPHIPGLNGPEGDEQIPDNAPPAPAPKAELTPAPSPRLGPGEQPPAAGTPPGSPKLPPSPAGSVVVVKEDDFEGPDLDLDPPSLPASPASSEPPALPLEEAAEEPLNIAGVAEEVEKPLSIADVLGLVSGPTPSEAPVAEVMDGITPVVVVPSRAPAPAEVVDAPIPGMPQAPMLSPAQRQEMQRVISVNSAQQETGRAIIQFNEELANSKGALTAIDGWIRNYDEDNFIARVNKARKVYNQAGELHPLTTLLYIMRTPGLAAKMLGNKDLLESFVNPGFGFDGWATKMKKAATDQDDKLEPRVYAFCELTGLHSSDNLILGAVREGTRSSPTEICKALLKQSIEKQENSQPSGAESKPWKAADFLENDQLADEAAQKLASE